MSGDHHGEENVPLTDTQRIIVIIVHYLTFVVCAWNIWCFLYKFDILRSRIWMPYLLLLGLIWLQIAAGLEIGNHYYVGDWELAGFQSDLINGSFYFFNFGGNYLIALGLRVKDSPFFRCPSKDNGIFNCVVDFFAMLFDILMVIALIFTAPLYAAIGRDSAISVISAFGAFAGIGTLFRLWRNLGPNRGTLWGGIIFLVLALTGVVMTAVYRSTGLEWLHIFIGGSFVASVIPLTIAILCSENEERVNEDNALMEGIVEEEGDLEELEP